jgi:hypothetical protein
MILAIRLLQYRVVPPALGIGAVMLHFYTTVVAFRLVDSWIWGCVAASAAWATPAIGELLVAYFTWRATGSMVNEYSVWLLAWIALLLGTGLLSMFFHRLQKSAE